MENTENHDLGLGVIDGEQDSGASFDAECSQPRPEIVSRRSAMRRNVEGEACRFETPHERLGDAASSLLGDEVEDRREVIGRGDREADGVRLHAVSEAVRYAMWARSLAFASSALRVRSGEAT